jgi:hypothetical protein
MSKMDTPRKMMKTSVMDRVVLVNKVGVRLVLS